MWPPGCGEYTCRRAMCVYVCIEKLTSRRLDDYLKASVIHLTSQLDESVPLTTREYLWTMLPPQPLERSQLRSVALDSLGSFYRSSIKWFANTTAGKLPLDRSRSLDWLAIMTWLAPFTIK